MAEDTGPWPGTSGQAAEQIAKQVQQTVANYFGLFQNISASAWGAGHPAKHVTGWGMSHATKHAEAVSAYVQKLSQATDVHDRLNAHASFVHMQIEMCQERAKVLHDAVAAASNLMGAWVSLLRWHGHLSNIAQNSPAYKESGGTKQKRQFTAKT
jgi:hypothetical protein